MPFSKTHTTESVLRVELQTPTAPSTVVAHNDSSWSTLPLSGICSTVSWTPLLSSQAGDRTAGGSFCMQLIGTRHLTEAKPPSVHHSHQWTCLSGHVFIPSLYYPSLRTAHVDNSVQGCRVDSLEQEIHQYSTCRDSEERHTTMCNIFFPSAFSGLYHPLQVPLCHYCAVLISFFVQFSVYRQCCHLIANCEFESWGECLHSLLNVHFVYTERRKETENASPSSIHVTTFWI